MAVELIETHKSVSEVSEELGIDKSLLYQWRKSFDKKGERGFSGNGKKSFTPAEEEKII